MLKYEIEGGNLLVVICYPEAGQTICTEQGSMSWMSPNMEVQTNTGGGFTTLPRIYNAEEIIRQKYDADGNEILTPDA